MLSLPTSAMRCWAALAFTPADASGCKRYPTSGAQAQCSMHNTAKALSVAVTLRLEAVNCARSHCRIFGGMGQHSGSSAIFSKSSSWTADGSKRRSAIMRRNGIGGSRSVWNKSNLLWGGCCKPRTVSMRTPLPKHSEPKQTSVSRSKSHGIASTRSTKMTTAPAAPPRSLCQSAKSNGPARNFCCCTGACGQAPSSGHHSFSSPSPSTTQAPPSSPAP
mmetsp:Transcript_132998/g.384642  ORF Transcript_132998/g.384642 Transcript_132998/m.384642 type:complete len:219 (-) Transcript_132998:873-1529(-)